MSIHQPAGRVAAMLVCLTIAAAPASAEPVAPAGGDYFVNAPVVAVTPRYRWRTVSEPVRRCVQAPGRGHPVGHAGAGWGTRYHGADHDHRDRHERRESPGQGAETAAGLVGGLIGGLVGHQFGGGNGKTALTIAGAVLGASIAREGVRDRAAERNRHRVRSYADASTAVHCSHTERSRRIREADGYHVTYRYHGSEHHKWMDRHPGDTVRVRVAVAPY